MVLSCKAEVNAADVPQLVVNQWVRYEAGTPLTGTLILPQANGQGTQILSACVAMVGDNGMAQCAQTDADGSFQFDNVKPGIYALTARGKDVFSVVALHVIDSADPDAAGYPATVEMPAAKIAYATVKSAIVRYLPPIGAAVPTVGIQNVKFDELSDKVVGNELFRVAKTDEGMVGRIYTAGARGSMLPAAAYTNVFVTKNGDEVARTVTDERGNFSIQQLPVGEYSLLSVGPSGLGLVGFELVDVDAEVASKRAEATARSAIGETLVAQIDMSCGCVQSFEMQCAPVVEVSQCMQEIVEAPCCTVEEVVISEVPCDTCGGEIVEEGFGSPMPGGGYAGGGGGYGGGFGGGGGGFGGGGGLLGLAAVGGIAAAAIAASDNNNNDFLQPLPASPGGF